MSQVMPEQRKAVKSPIAKLSNNTALITGASRGIGAAIAKRLAALTAFANSKTFLRALFSRVLLQTRTSSRALFD
jgi:short-subunit dehydrogenase